MSKYVYMFGGGTADGDGTMKDTLGGKGSGLAEMSRAGVPVPPGFTIITDVCNVFFDNDKKVPAEVDQEIWTTYHSVQPAHVLLYDGVPIISVYKNPKHR